MRFTFEKRPGVAVEIQLYSENGLMVRQLATEDSLVLKASLERFAKHNQSIFYGELIEVKFYEKINSTDIMQIISLDGRYKELISCNVFEEKFKKTIVAIVKS